eukprot:scaffold13066_cov45-Phaeocystis_antarctica.AAC.2
MRVCGAREQSRTASTWRRSPSSARGSARSTSLRAMPEMSVFGARRRSCVGRSCALRRRLVAALPAFLDRTLRRADSAGAHCRDAWLAREARHVVVDGERSRGRARDELQLNGAAGRVVRAACGPR